MEQVKTHEETVKLEALLTKCFADLKAKNTHQSESQISKKLGMTRSTFNRIKNEKSSGRFDNILRIIIGSGNPELVMEFLEIYDKKLVEKVRGTLSVALEEPDLCWENAELERLLADPSCFVSHILAALPEGTNERQLLEVLGSAGIDAMKTLIEKGLVEEREARYFIKGKEKIARSFESAKHHIPTYAQYYRPGDPTPNRGYIHSLTEGVNREGLKELQKLHRKFHQEVREIYNDERYRGEIPSFSVAFNDTFTKINHSNKKEELQ